MAVTIKDVAKQAGVAPSTVTRVIHDSPSISEKTKIKVRSVMKELNYFPNLNARSLASKKSSVIGLVLPDATDAFYQNPFFPTVMRGLNEEGAKSGYSLLLTTGQNHKDRFNNVQRMVFGRQVDGLIFLYSRKEDPILDFVIQQDFPFVMIGQPVREDIPFVNNNNRQMAQDATTYLINNGASKIGFIGGDTRQQFIHDRLEGFQQALEEAGIGCSKDWVFNDVNFLQEDGYEIAKQIAKMDRFEAFVVADQFVAVGFKSGWEAVESQNTPIMTFKSYRSTEHLNSTADAYININALELGKASFAKLLKVIDEDNNIEFDSSSFVQHELVTI